MTAKDRAIRAGLDVLREHYETNDPFQDDNPSARAWSAAHRKICPHCKAYAAYLRSIVKGKTSA